MKDSIELHSRRNTRFWATTKKNAFLPMLAADSPQGSSACPATSNTSNIYLLPQNAFLHMKGESQHLKIFIPNKLRCSIQKNPGFPLADSKGSSYYLKNGLSSMDCQFFHMESSSKELLENFRQEFLRLLEVSNEIKELHISLRGVGYRADLANACLQLNIGKSHPILFQIPENMEVEVLRESFPLIGTGDGQRILLKGRSMDTLNAFADQVRKARPLEVYKGKGVLIRNTKNLRNLTAFRKEGKKKKNS